MKKQLLLIVAMMMAMCSYATITPTGTQFWWGYFSESEASGDDFTSLGTGYTEDFDAAIRIPANQEVVGSGTIKAVRIWFGSALSSFKSLKVWISSSLPSNVSNTDYVQTVDVKGLVNGANDIELNTPFEINNKEVYIGYTVSIKRPVYPIMVGGTWVENSLYLRSSKNVTQWGAISDFGKLAMQVLVDGVELVGNAAEPTAFGTEYVLKGQSVDMPVSIVNTGKNDIKSISYTITTNGNTSGEKTISVNNIGSYDSQTVMIPFTADADARKYTKTLTITKVNGAANEASQKSAEGVVVTILEKPTVMPVVEEFTGTWCGWCPVGFDGLEKMYEKYGDKVALIAVHYGDPMETSDYSPILAQVVDGFPSSFVNRAYSVYPAAANLEYYIDYCLQQTVPAGIKTAAEWTNADKTAIKIQTSTTFAYSDEGVKYGIAYVLVEDGMKGEGSDWAQANNLSGNSTYKDLEFWYNAGSKVSGLEFNHVAVAAWNLVSGVSGSISSNVKAGEVQKHNFNADISGNKLIQDKSKLKIIALLIDQSTNVIVNAAQTTVGASGTGIEAVKNTAQEVVGYYTVDGKRLAAPVKGVNIVRMSDGSSRKMVVR